MAVKNKLEMVIKKTMMRIHKFLIEENNLMRISTINQTKRNMLNSSQTNDSLIIRIKGIKLINNIRKMTDKNKKEFKIKRYSSIKMRTNKLIKKSSSIRNLILRDLRLSNVWFAVKISNIMVLVHVVTMFVAGTAF